MTLWAHSDKAAGGAEGGALEPESDLISWLSVGDYDGETVSTARPLSRVLGPLALLMLMGCAGDQPTSPPSIPPEFAQLGQGSLEDMIASVTSLSCAGWVAVARTEGFWGPEVRVLRETDQGLVRGWWHFRWGRAPGEPRPVVQFSVARAAWERVPERVRRAVLTEPGIRGRSPFISHTWPWAVVVAEEGQVLRVERGHGRGPRWASVLAAPLGDLGFEPTRRWSRPL